VLCLDQDNAEKLLLRDDTLKRYIRQLETVLRHCK
jgi:hypothetical protein